MGNPLGHLPKDVSIQTRSLRASEVNNLFALARVLQNIRGGEGIEVTIGPTGILVSSKRKKKGKGGGVVPSIANFQNYTTDKTKLEVIVKGSTEIVECSVLSYGDNASGLNDLSQCVPQLQTNDEVLVMSIGEEWKCICPAFIQWGCEYSGSD